MAVSVSDYPNVRERAAILGYKIPGDVILLPWNFGGPELEEELFDTVTAPIVEQFLREADIPATRLEKNGTKLQTIHFKALDWIGPGIFIAAQMLTNNPEIVNNVLTRILEYLGTTFFKGVVGPKQTRIEFIIEKTKGKKYVDVQYDGPYEGAKELIDILEKTIKD